MLLNKTDEVPALGVLILDREHRQKTTKQTNEQDISERGKCGEENTAAGERG